MKDDHEKRIARIHKRPELQTGNELAKPLERHKLPETIEQIEGGKKEDRVTTALKKKLLFDRTLELVLMEVEPK